MSAYGNILQVSQPAYFELKVIIHSYEKGEKRKDYPIVL